MLPQHIAIIMDGNRRWAKEKDLPAIMGHRAGVKTVDRITEACARKGIKGLTLYGFSTENWNRTAAAVKALFLLIEESAKEYIKKVKENNVRIRLIGRIDGLPASLRGILLKAAEETASNTGLVLTLALNYGGRQEIVDAVKSICEKVKKTDFDFTSLSENDFGKWLYDGGLPDPDMIIRTSGEMRLSNFLLWQSAYSEFYATDVLWPDFDETELEKALEEYDKRDRRFGG